VGYEEGEAELQLHLKAKNLIVKREIMEIFDLISAYYLIKAKAPISPKTVLAHYIEIGSVSNAVDYQQG
jgi:hypothetical protein